MHYAGSGLYLWVSKKSMAGKDQNPSPFIVGVTANASPEGANYGVAAGICRRHAQNCPGFSPDAWLSGDVFGEAYHCRRVPGYIGTIFCKGSVIIRPKFVLTVSREKVDRYFFGFSFPF